MRDSAASVNGDVTNEFIVSVLTEESIDSPEDGLNPESIVTSPEVEHLVISRCGLTCCYASNSSRTEDSPSIFDFQLDRYQSIGIDVIDSDMCNIIVCAPTTSGKTYFAEHIFNKVNSCESVQRAFYTSPIKALSNQKFSDFCGRNKVLKNKVGIITGDVSKNEDSRSMVMTAEVLHDLLLRGSPSYFNDLRWVIFDEIHYLSDRERGVVWEEIIISLPSHVRLVLLSATIINSTQIARWLTLVRNRPCHVICTKKRPVPLTYHLCAGKCNQKQFVRNYHDIGKALLNMKNSDKQLRSDALQVARKNNTRGREPMVEMWNHLRNREFAVPESAKKCAECTDRICQLLFSEKDYPALLFSFRKLYAELYASAICGSINHSYLTEEELTRLNERLSTYFALCGLKESELESRWVANHVWMWRRGVAVHHGGLLLVVREVVEKLFQDGLVKFLVATDTFSSGINAPARVVVVTELRKFDGSVNRFIYPEEFTQMAGRAGRRGHDPEGKVIVLCAADTRQRELDHVMFSPQKPLTSCYRVTTKMALASASSQHRGSQVNTGNMVQRSLLWFQTRTEEEKHWKLHKPGTLDNIMCMENKLRELLLKIGLLERRGNEVELTERGNIALQFSHWPVLMEFVVSSRMFDNSQVAPEDLICLLAGLRSEFWNTANLKRAIPETSVAMCERMEEIRRLSEELELPSARRRTSRFGPEPKPPSERLERAGDSEPNEYQLYVADLVPTQFESVMASVSRLWARRDASKDNPCVSFEEIYHDANRQLKGNSVNFEGDLVKCIHNCRLMCLALLRVSESQELQDRKEFIDLSRAVKEAAFACHRGFLRATSIHVTGSDSHAKENDSSHHVTGSDSSHHVTGSDSRAKENESSGHVKEGDSSGVARKCPAPDEIFWKREANSGSEASGKSLSDTNPTTVSRAPDYNWKPATNIWSETAQKSEYEWDSKPVPRQIVDAPPTTSKPQRNFPQCRTRGDTYKPKTLPQGQSRYGQKSSTAAKRDEATCQNHHSPDGVESRHSSRESPPVFEFGTPPVDSSGWAAAIGGDTSSIRRNSNASVESAVSSRPARRVTRKPVKADQADVASERSQQEKQVENVTESMASIDASIHEAQKKPLYQNLVTESDSEFRRINVRRSQEPKPGTGTQDIRHPKSRVPPGFEERRQSNQISEHIRPDSNQKTPDFRHPIQANFSSFPPESSHLDLLQSQLSNLISPELQRAFNATVNQPSTPQGAWKKPLARTPDQSPLDPTPDCHPEVWKTMQSPAPGVPQSAGDNSGRSTPSVNSKKGLLAKFNKAKGV